MADSKIKFTKKRAKMHFLLILSFIYVNFKQKEQYNALGSGD